MERLSILAGVPVLKRNISIPFSRKDCDNELADCNPLGPV